MQCNTEGGPDACADRDRRPKFVFSLSHNLQSPAWNQKPISSAFSSLPARRCVFLRRAALFLTLSLPLGFPMTYRLHHLPGHTSDEKKGAFAIPSCFISRYSSLLVGILRLALYAPGILPLLRLRSFIS